MSDSAAFRQATGLLRAGRPLEAEALLVDTARVAERRGGERSAAHAAAQFDLARLLLMLGDPRRAAGALRRACALEAESEHQTKDRLTYMMNLGEVLERLGELDEAENVLRQSLGERATFYGVDHPGYAFGLEPLAALELARGRAGAARHLAEQALHVLLESGHPRAAALMALRAFAVVADAGGDPFGELDALDGAGLDELVRGVLDRAEHSEPELSLAVLSALRTAIGARQGDGADWLLHVVAAISSFARDAGAHAARLEALGWLAEALDVRGDAEQAIEAVLGLALAESDRGRNEAAERHYRAALGRARELDALTKSKVLRNYGLWAASVERTSDAAGLLEAAVTEARLAEDAALLGQALVALGIFRQHRGALPDAEELLDQGLALLPATHPDALCGRSHLSALERGDPCGCGDVRATLSRALRELVEHDLPAGLVAALALDDGDGGIALRVELAREPTPAESELLGRVLHQGVTALGQSIRERR